MPQINCLGCNNQFFADSPGPIVTSVGFAIAGAIVCRLCFGHLVIDGIDLDLSKAPIDLQFVPQSQMKPAGSGLSHAATELAAVIGWWAVIGLFAGALIGLAVDHFSRRCPKCGHKQ